MATLDQLSNALINADRAGDVEAARALAAEISRMRAASPETPSTLPQTQQPSEPQQVDARDNWLGRADTFIRGAADTMSFGMADEIAAGGDALLNPLFGTGQDGGSLAERYDRNLKAQRTTDEIDAKKRTAERLTGQILGAVGGGVGLARNGLSATTNAINAGKGLRGVTVASAKEGAVLGALQGFGTGEGFDDRISSSTTGLAAGLGVGAALPGATTAIAGAVKGATAPFVAPFRPAAYTDKALRTYLQRSGKTPEQIADIMRSAADDGQSMYTVADAMGNAGQRALVPVTRTPNDARQEVTDFLVRRQLGQPQRLANALAEGFDAPQTSDQVSRALTNARDIEADQLYTAARRGAGPVNVTPILDRIDETLLPGVNRVVSPRDNIGYDTIEGALARVRRMISDGNSQVTDFNALFRAKLDLDDMITKAEGQGAGNRANYLSQVKREVDRALENASPAYRNANDTFASRSRVIDSVAEGQAAKSGRVRSENSIEQFNALTPEQQQAFRSGYVDPIIADIESLPMGPATNRARGLTTPKYEHEFQAFAAPGRAEQLGNRIGRENRMFETSNAALGNSRTADNLGDIDDMANFDPAVLTNLLTGNWKQAALTGARQAFNAGKGLPPRVVERVGRSLVETDPNQALATLNRVRGQQVSRDQLRAMILESMLQGSNAGIARLP
ncbi:hypothetical protein [Sinorhizobium meliloti]|uniref:hypothetical protein n=1 Tax=Rhizobium meliloti TaxID=382 RepID=UPI000FDC297A|nr:hypothetical protein [Sinorhizobium meliloti]RVG83255.1 hypothetical protein CN219_18275 [Sinorhizobium meliloti]RVI38059.1 hypothetical protein CN197_06490 [Sinorhizobium meliloti]RVI49479.1 hypothetical protein CN196_00875 [Sinorhizobium meliloti]RVJ24100.1 hypothetical protein CN177_16670 [Sinorhizobium meliloti]RVK03286.1 hypothetical protein CN170_04775 [Sinorhizobium meliloti]